MHIRPLRPLIPSSNAAASTLVCPPYDVVTAAEARALHAANPNSFISVVRPDVTLPPTSPIHTPAAYAAAAASLTGLHTAGHLTREPAATLYIYSQTAPGQPPQLGLVALTRVADYTSGLIRKHERTRPAKEADRTTLTHALSANTGPVFLTYRDVPAVDDLVSRVAAAAPLFDVTADDAVRHCVWRVPDLEAEALVALFQSQVPVAYIADGHHRAASAANVGAKRRIAAGDGPDQDFDWFLAVLFPASHLRILAYNRLVTDLNHRSDEQFVAALRMCGELRQLEHAPSDVPGEAGVVFVFVSGVWYRLKLQQDSRGISGVADALDCSVLQRLVLAPVLGVDDPRNSDRIQFVGGSKGVPFLEDKVRHGEAAVAFVLHPVTVKQLMHVADRDEIMPPKSTWFEPKLRSGFFVHTF